MSNPNRHKLSKAQFEELYNYAMNVGIPALLVKIDNAQKTREAYKTHADLAYPDDNKDRIWAYFDANCGFWKTIKNTLEEYALDPVFDAYDYRFGYHPDYSPRRKALTEYKVNGKPLFLHLIGIAPEIGNIITRCFRYDNYDFLRNKEMIEYLALPTFGKSNSTLGNRLRRKNVVEGKDPFSPIEVPNGNKEDQEGKTDYYDYNNPVRKKRVLRESILSAVAYYFSKQHLNKYEIDGEDINKETVLALQNIIKDYPDILSSEYNFMNGSKETFGNYIINSVHRNPIEFFPAFANKRGANKDGYYEEVESSYTISPEEVIWYGIKAGNAIFLRNFNAKNASIFTAQTRINEHIENIAKIAVNNPDYLREIAGSFLRNTTYVTEKYPSKLAIAKYFQNEAIATGDPELANKMANLTSRIVGVKIVNKPSEFMQNKLPLKKDSAKDKTIQKTLFDNFTNSRSI